MPKCLKTVCREQDYAATTRKIFLLGSIISTRGRNRNVLRPHKHLNSDQRNRNGGTVLDLDTKSFKRSVFESQYGVQSQSELVYGQLVFNFHDFYK